MVMMVVVMMMPIGRLVMQATVPVVMLGLAAIRVGSMLAGFLGTGSTVRGRIQTEVQVMKVTVVMERCRRVVIIKVGIVLGRWRWWKGITVVRVWIFCTFLKIPVVLLLHPRTIVVVVEPAVDVIRTTVVVIIIVVVHIVHAHITDTAPYNVILAVAAAPMVVMMMVASIMPSTTTSSASANIIR